MSRQDLDYRKIIDSQPTYRIPIARSDNLLLELVTEIRYGSPESHYEITWVNRNEPVRTYASLSDALDYYNIWNW